MNRKELVDAIARETGLPRKNAELAVRTFVDIVSEELRKGERVQLSGFGSFEVSEREAHVGINPQTGEPVEISCAIGDETVDGKPYAKIVETAREFIERNGGFEKFAEWGLL